MAFLEKKKLVHRDLAARNVLIADDNTAKVSGRLVATYGGADTVKIIIAGLSYNHN